MQSVITWIPQYAPEHSILDRIPSLRSALLYSDHITLLVPTSDDLAEDVTFHSLQDTFTSVSYETYSERDGESFRSLADVVARYCADKNIEAASRVELELLAVSLEEETNPHAVIEAFRSAAGFSRDLGRRIANRHEVLLDLCQLTIEVSERENGFPIFDDVASVLTPSARRRAQSEMTVLVQDRAKQASLSHDLVWRIPAVSTASIAELADVRTELQVPLGRFRSGIVRLRAELTATPLEPRAFQHEAQDLFDREVRPDLIER